jgi:hypothetical protein
MRGADYTAAMRPAILVVVGRSPEMLLANLDATRGTGNKWLHRTEPVTPQDSAKGIEVAQKMITGVLQSSLRVSPGTYLVDI